MLHIVDGKWHQTDVQSNVLSFAQKLFPKKVQFVKNEGPLTKLLNELGASKILRLDVIQDAQAVLNLPTRYKSILRDIKETNLWSLFILDSVSSHLTIDQS